MKDDVDHNKEDNDDKKVESKIDNKMCVNDDVPIKEKIDDEEVPMEDISEEDYNEEDEEEDDEIFYEGEIFEYGDKTKDMNEDGDNNNTKDWKNDDMKESKMKMIYIKDDVLITNTFTAREIKDFSNEIEDDTIEKDTNEEMKDMINSSINYEKKGS